ncbi:MAG: hypothetical protein NVSMB9_23370 [Isosphaeraceae bacterium]
MAVLNQTIQHGQTWDVARANFEKGISLAQGKFGNYLRSVEWSPDKTSARLTGPGFNVLVSIDEKEVHASGDVPFFARFLEAPVRKFIEQTFRPA